MKWKKNRVGISDQAYFGYPKRCRRAIAKGHFLSDEQIILAGKLKEDFMRNALTDDYGESQSISLNVLAVVYFREQRYAESLNVLERAHNRAVKFHASATVVKQIVENGETISKVAGDSGASATWSQR